MLKTNDIDVSGNIFDVFHVENLSQLRSFLVNQVGLQNQRTGQFIEIAATKTKQVKSKIKDVCEYRISVESDDFFNIKEVICYINLKSGKLTGFCSSKKLTGVTWKLNRVFCSGEV